MSTHVEIHMLQKLLLQLHLIISHRILYFTSTLKKIAKFISNVASELKWPDDAVLCTQWKNQSTKVKRSGSPDEEAASVAEGWKSLPHAN